MYVRKMKGKHKSSTVLLVCCLCLFLNWTYRSILPAVLPLIEEEFRISHAVAGSLFTYINLPYAAMLFVGGMLSIRFGTKRLALISIVLFSAFTFLIGFTRNVFELTTALLLFGMGLGFYYPNVLSLLSSWFSRERRGGVLGIYLASGALGRIVSPIVVGEILKVSGWRTPYQLFAILGLISSILFWKYVDEPSQTSSLGNIKFREVLRDPVLLSLFPCYVAAVAISFGAFSMIPLFFVQEFHLDVSLVAMIIGLSQVAGLVGSPLGGFLSDKVGRRPVLVSALTLSAALTIGLINLPYPWNLLTLFLQVLVSSMLVPVSQTLVADRTPQGVRAGIMSLYSTLGILVGAGLIPLAIGWIADISTFRLAFLLPVGLTILGVVFLLRVKGSDRSQ